jgi:hypothetical protein
MAIYGRRAAVKEIGACPQAGETFFYKKDLGSLTFSRDSTAK